MAFQNVAVMLLDSPFVHTQLRVSSSVCLVRTNVIIRLASDGNLSVVVYSSCIGCLPGSLW